MKPQHTRIPSLDGLRAISISLVIIAHLMDTFEVQAQGPLQSVSRWAESLHLGQLGVRVFFVISGFLITDLLLQELATSKHINLAKFYFRRTLRIFPPYYFFVLAMIILHVIGWAGITFNDIFHAFTYTTNYYPERAWETGHSWSLSVEEQFYLLWPAVLLFTGRRRGLWVAFAFVILCPLIRLGYYYFVPSLVKYEIGYRFETVADAIAVGCLLAGLRVWLAQQRPYERILKSKLFLLVPIAVLAANLLNDRGVNSLLLGISIQNIGIAACIAWATTNYSGRIGRVLNSKPLVFVGVMSYSIYLWQQPFLNPQSSLVIARFPWNISLVAAASLLSYYLIERHALQIRRRLEARIFAPTHSIRRDKSEEPVTPDVRVPQGSRSEAAGSVSQGAESPISVGVSTIEGQ